MPVCSACLSIIQVVGFVFCKNRMNAHRQHGCIIKCSPYGCYFPLHFFALLEMFHYIQLYQLTHETIHNLYLWFSSVNLVRLVWGNYIIRSENGLFTLVKCYLVKGNGLFLWNLHVAICLCSCLLCYHRYQTYSSPGGALCSYCKEAWRTENLFSNEGTHIREDLRGLEIEGNLL